jgi:hypothetical protein
MRPIHPLVTFPATGGKEAARAAGVPSRGRRGRDGDPCHKGGAPERMLVLSDLSEKRRRHKAEGNSRQLAVGREQKVRRTRATALANRSTEVALKSPVGSGRRVLDRGRALGSRGAWLERDFGR